MNRNNLNSIVDSHYAVYSFDLFDTVFFRKYISLDEILYSSCQYLSGFLEGSFSIASLVEERKRLGQTLKHSLTLKTQEPRLADILSTLVSHYELAGQHTINEAVSKTISFELSLESSALHLHPQVTDILERLYSDGRHIICITDMYFDQAQILSILDALGIRHLFNNVFVSSEIGLTKQSGDLFSHVSSALGVPANEILHVGDKLSSDVKSAQHIGMDSKLVAFNTRLKPAFDHAEDIHHLNSRLSTAFLLDLIQTCHARKISKLFFLSRDATVLGEICRTLMTSDNWVSQFFSNLNILDLDISRASTAFLELEWKNDGLEKIIALYLKNIGSKDLNSFLNYFDLPSVPESLYTEGLKSSDWPGFIRETDSAYENRIMEGAKSRNKRVIEYLQQSGAIRAGKVAFVDIGYAGTISRRISSYLIRHATERPSETTRIHCFFVLTNNHLAKNAESARPLALMNTLGFLNCHTIPGILRGNGAWLETFYQDKMRGPLLGYRASDDGKMVSMFTSVGSAAESSGSEAMNRLLSRKTEQNSVLLASKFQSGLLIKNFLKEMAAPSTRTVDALKDCQYLTGNSDQSSHFLVKDISVSELAPYNIRRLINSDYWLSGSIRNSGYARLNPVLSAILSLYYKSTKLSIDIRHGVRCYLSKYAKPVVEYLLTHLEILKAKLRP